MWLNFTIETHPQHDLQAGRLQPLPHCFGSCSWPTAVRCLWLHLLLPLLSVVAWENILSAPPIPSLPACLFGLVCRPTVCLLLVGPNEFILQKWKVYVLGSYTWWLCIRFGWMSTAGDLCQWRTKNRSAIIAIAPNEDASLGVNSRGLFICLHWEFGSKVILTH